MANLRNPEFTGEKLRALIEFVVPSRQNVVGGAVLNIEKTVNEFSYSSITSNTTATTPEQVTYSSEKPQETAEKVVAKQDPVKSNQTRKVSVQSPGTNLTTSTARANLSAIYSSIGVGEQK